MSKRSKKFSSNDDGSVVTLDELCDELGLERLPYLEEMPEEIDLAEEE